MITAILFDADNTLYDTSAVTRLADMAAMEYFSDKSTCSPESLYLEWKGIVDEVKGLPDPAKRHRLYSYGLLAQRHGLRGASRAYKVCLETVLARLKLCHGAMHMLRQLSGHKMAIITEDSGLQVKKKLARLGINDYFRTVISSDTTKHMKPHESYYKIAWSRLRVRPGECLVIGDDYAKDLSIPHTLGCVTVLYGEEPSEADYTISDLSELPKIVQSIDRTNGASSVPSRG